MESTDTQCSPSPGEETQEITDLTRTPTTAPAATSTTNRSNSDSVKGEPRNMLSQLLRTGGRGRPARTASANSRSAQRRRVLRTDQAGIATKVAMVFESTLAHVNLVHGLDQFPVTLRDVLSFMQEGKPILEECKTTTQNEILAQAQLDLASGTGRAHTSTVLGAMAKSNKKGKLSVKFVAKQTNKSETWVRACRQEVEKNGLGEIGAKSKSGFRKVQRLCPTRLDPALGECLDTDCGLLHDCQLCKDGSQCSASACKNWDAAKALRADKARVH